MTTSLKWEQIDRTDDGITTTYRARVFGGWLVNSRTYNPGGSSNSIIFLEDKEGKWIL
jgi:hypothetical protein